MDSQEPKQAGADDALLNAVEAIYGCVTDPSEFERLPEMLAPLLDARTVNVWRLDADLEPAATGNHGLPGSATRHYQDWMRNNPRVSKALDERLRGTISPKWMSGRRVGPRFDARDHPQRRVVTAQETRRSLPRGAGDPAMTDGRGGSVSRSRTTTAIGLQHHEPPVRE